MNIEQERRAITGIEIRQSQGERPRLVGYAAVFNSRSQELPPGFVEIIRPGAFARSLREYPDIRAFVEHEPVRIIGRTKANPPTLKVEEDTRGLRVEIFPPDTPDGKAVVENIKIGNLDAMSFAFRLFDGNGERWNFESKPVLREIIETRVFEVSVVASPAYLDTSVAARSMAQRQRDSIDERLALMERRARAWR